MPDRPLPRLHECPDCQCPLPSQDQDPRFRKTPRLERWAWLILGLATGCSHGVGADGSIRRYKFGRKWVLARLWSSLWPVRKYKRLRHLILAGPRQPCGCRFNRFTGKPMGGCTEHLFARVVGPRHKKRPICATSTDAALSPQKSGSPSIDQGTLGRKPL